MIKIPKAVTVRVKINKNYTKNMKKAIKRGLLKGAFEVERKAKVYSPIDTGLLSRSISIDRPMDETADGFAITISPKVFYAEFMERPGRVLRRGRRPFMQPALIDSFNKIKLHIFREIKRVK